MAYLGKLGAGIEDFADKFGGAGSWKATGSSGNNHASTRGDGKNISREEAAARELLGLEPHGPLTREQITAAYRAYALHWHRDQNVNKNKEKPLSEEEMRELDAKVTQGTQARALLNSKYPS